MTEKIRLGISACLVGEHVRYDGGHKFDQYLKDALGQYAEWVPVCPEAECGLPVPREEMRLSGGPVHPHLITCNTGIDYTEVILKWTGEKLDALEREGLGGFVFKCRSPSCGIRDAEIYLPDGHIVKGAGIFSSAFMARFTGLAAEDEESLRDPVILKNFIQRVLSR